MSEMYSNPGENNFVPEKPKKSRKKLIIILSIIATVVVAASVTATVILNTPKMLVARGFANSLKAMNKNEVVALLKSAGEKGSVGVSLGLGELLESAMGIDIDAQASLTLYARDSHSAMKADLSVDGESFADATLMLSKDDIVFSSEAMLDGDAYGIDLKNAADNFEDSVFGPYGALSLGIYDIDPILDVLEESRELEEDLNALLKDGFETLLKSMDEHAEVSKETEKLSFNGESAKVTAVEFELDDDAIKAVLEDMIDYLAESKQLKKILGAYDELVGPYSGYYDYYGNYISYSIEEDFYEALDEAKDSLDDLEIGKSDKISLTFYVTKSGTQLVGINLTAKFDGDRVEMELLAGPNWKSLSEIRFEMNTDYNEMVVSYAVDKDDKSDYSAALSVENGGDSAELLSVEWDKKNGDFELVVYDTRGRELGAIEGNLILDKKSGKFSVEYIMDQPIDITITLKAEDKIPGIPKDYEDILTMSLEEFRGVGSQIGVNLMEKVSDLDEDIQDLLNRLMW